jgi:DNA-directed RNA polymerase specialized sigma24 family protein
MRGRSGFATNARRQCVQLRSEGFDYTEIAAELAIRPGTVGALLHRATEKLRSRLWKKGNGA